MQPNSWYRKWRAFHGVNLQVCAGSLHAEVSSNMLTMFELERATELLASSDMPTRGNPRGYQQDFG